MNKRIRLVIFLIYPVLYAGAQTTSTPYSAFGSGQISGYGFGTNQAMGGTGIAFPSSDGLNNLNPASYGSIDSTTFIFEAGMYVKYSDYSTFHNRENLVDGNLDYLALGFRVTKWWSTSFGIVPYSKVNYVFKTTESVVGEMQDYEKEYNGSGGINKFYSGNSIRIGKNLSLGFNASFLLGSITRNEIVSNIGATEGYYLDETVYVRNFYFDYGLQYRLRRGGLDYRLGLIYGNKRLLSTKYNRNLYYLTDSIHISGHDKNFYIPRKYGIGISVGKEDKFIAGVDYERRDWSEIEYDNDLLETRNSNRISAGFEYTPYSRINDAGLKRLYYRAGAYYKQSYLVIDNIPINSFGITAGVGIPIRRDRSRINLSFEWGQNGTHSEGLIKEQYWLFRLNFSLQDTWFLKPKFY